MYPTLKIDHHRKSTMMTALLPVEVLQVENLICDKLIYKISFARSTSWRDFRASINVLHEKSLLKINNSYPHRYYRSKWYRGTRQTYYTFLLITDNKSKSPYISMFYTLVLGDIYIWQNNLQDLFCKVYKLNKLSCFNQCITRKVTPQNQQFLPTQVL